jgi:predicted RNA-binding protein with PUA-like domain
METRAAATCGRMAVGEEATMWLLKTEPGTYSYDDLEREGRTVWDGVTNPVALKNLRAMKAGDAAFVYHTGAERAVVGRAEVVKPAYPDPRNERLVVVELRAAGRLGQPVTLDQIKKLPLFADSPLVRQGRLSVVPLTPAQAAALERGGRP